MINKLPQYSISQKPVFLGKKTAKSEQNNEHNEVYNDPLMKWPVRGLAYTNELGAALSEIAPTLGILLWFPAMLYFGADIYDKYKNEQTSYNPNTQRGSKQAVFQLLASVLFPTAAVILGQQTASVLGSLGKSGLSLQTQEEITSFLQKFAGRRHLEDYKDNSQEFRQLFEESIVTKREKLVRSNKFKNPFEWLHSIIIKRSHPEVIALSQKDKVLQYADKNINQMFKIYNDLVNNRRPTEFSDKLWKKFNNLKESYAKDPDYKATYIRDAAEDVILKFQKNQIRNAKLLKTLGGFVALGIAIKPIDHFVENVVIKKGVEPLVQRVNTRFENK